MREAEGRKPTIYGVKGENLTIASMDQDYQMIDSHIDINLRKKILSYDYIDFSKLIPNSKTGGDDDFGQRLEIINKNGVSFLVPVTDKEKISINSYSKWEIAFRVYSNVLTAKFSHKSTELLQYNHCIHNASTTFVWDNVYAYDKEFRRHISRYPSRSWAVILQQAWSNATEGPT